MLSSFNKTLRFLLLKRCRQIKNQVFSQILTYSSAISLAFNSARLNSLDYDYDDVFSIQIYIAIKQMNDLASLKHRLFYEYSEQQQHLWHSKNFYQHHKMPLRHLITSQKKGMNIYIADGKAKDNPQQKNKLVKIGRDIFNDVQKSKIPGPGSYDQKSNDTNHGYIRHQQTHLLQKPARKLRKSQAVIRNRGPGIYNYDECHKSTSKSKTAILGKVLKQKIDRNIISGKCQENIFLSTTLSEKQLKRSAVPGPDKYKVESQNMRKTTQFMNPSSYKISNTSRSSIINQKNKYIPGPGSYKWQKFYEKPLQSQKPKSGIQFKFVYGHPS